MKDLVPVVFDWTRPLFGLGFLAHITANGRVVFAREDDGKWWGYGVEPGGIAEGGGTSHEASLAFFKGLDQIAADIASRSGSFEEFKVEIESFFAAADDEEARAWDAAFGRLGEGSKPVDDPFFASLRTVPLRPSSVVVERIEQQEAYTPDLNRDGDIALPEAA